MSEGILGAFVLLLLAAAPSGVAAQGSCGEPSAGSSAPGAPVAEPPPSPLPRPGPAAPLSLRPIRTNTPGTGVFIGSGVLARVLWDRRSSDGLELEDVTAVVDFRYTPATHWVVGVRVPVVLSRELRGDGLGASSSGLGDVSLGVKHRFFRSVGRWSDRHAAVEVEVGLPAGRSRPDLPPGLEPIFRDRLRPSTGAVDWSVDVVYQEGRRRFVYGGDLLYRRGGEGEEGYRRGDAVRLNFDVEHILYPFEYRRPGNEVFVLLEGALLRHGKDELDGRTVAGTGRTELLLAPGIQHVATEQMLMSVSLQFPVWYNVGSRELERDLNLLAEVRFAF